ncbi:MAG TPA: bifunctional [glutamate--ammonia ligase]-adenylyl-L-tyrosine phosphorylase/[glutamate--ammonia-ligase] adenylyltransferase [Candidatus Paceibacterota bacterium]|nr:bifunctional [glutamate--ammonia ligase]-adenylyl-L-tyrosine phosphorylase/[glutamate--ammonia-ligase] adenylyltransferase [Candidatus Paceibacterota bacterium]
MKTAVWKQAIQSSVDSERVRHFLDQLVEAGAETRLVTASGEQARILSALFSGSTVLGNLLVAHPDWLAALEPEAVKFPRRVEGLRNEVISWLQPLFASRDYRTAFSRLREFKARELMRIAARDLARLGEVVEITRELSDLADVTLDAVWRICMDAQKERYGQPWHQDAQGRWIGTEACVLGMGKLGGQELNYSSDVDVLFVYDEEGQVFKESPKGKAPRSVMTSHSFFNRVAEAFIAEVSRIAPEGMLFRIDLRLRPEGDAGPLCRSLGSYENYYAQWGQTWERMMLIKARGVAGSRNLAGEFLEMVQPFRYPRAVGETVLQEIGAMKDRIEAEVVKAGELDRNVKLGRGGIREVEFIAQSQQLLHAGRIPFLQGAQTLPALEKLSQYKILGETETAPLREAYCFLRDVEHRLQMEENRQTHTIPNHKPSQERLARLMGFKTWKDFEKRRAALSGRVEEIFNKLFRSEKPEAAAGAFPNEFNSAEAEWKLLLEEHCFRDPENAFQILREFVEGPGYVHVSSRTVKLAHRLLPRLFALCRKRGVAVKRNGGAPGEFQLSDPDRVVTRLDSFIAAYGARAVLFELWNSNPIIFELLVKLFDRSEFLAELAIRTPDMVDELVTSGRLRQRKTMQETMRDLRHGLKDADQGLWMRRYHQVELMRIGLRDILGLADPEQCLTELSALAEASLQYAVEVALRRHKLKTAPFVVIGLGKLGGGEIDYGSDLDIIFVARSTVKNLRKLQAVAMDVMELLSARTEAGVVFQTDARLRPDGEKGLLVNTLRAYEDYYRSRAQIWEIQSLSRTRVVAGDLELGTAFQKLAARLTNFAQPILPLAAYSADWKTVMHKMRIRIERERTPAGKDHLAIKTGKGGFMDAEFIAQALCLEHGWHEPNTLRALEKGREASVLPEAGRLIESYRELRRVEGILRRWSYEGEVVLPDDPAPYYRVSVRCGFETPEAFRAALEKWRGNVRAVYLKVFQG